MFLSVEVVLKTYQVQDTISFVEHLIQQVLQRDVRLVLNTELKDQKTQNKNKVTKIVITNRTMIPVGCGLRIKSRTITHALSA